MQVLLELFWLYVWGCCLIKPDIFSPDSVSWPTRWSSPLWHHVRYFPPVRFPSTMMYNNTVPFTEKQLRILMLPPPCFAVSIVFLGSHTRPFLLRTWRAELLPKVYFERTFCVNPVVCEISRSIFSEKLNPACPWHGQSHRDHINPPPFWCLMRSEALDLYLHDCQVYKWKVWVYFSH